jgi:tetratricopeptide (TPR) repeat protein
MEVFDRAVQAHRSGDHAAAERLFREATAWGFNNLAILKTELGAYAEAVALYRDAVAVDPTHDEAIYGLSLLLLAAGDYAEGWRLYEARRRLERIYTPAVRPILPEWQGEPLSGRRIAVFGEQGFGDQILFARFLRELEQRGATVSYYCAPEVAPLFPGASAVVNAGILAAHDFWTYAGSLPYRLRTRPETVPAPAALSGAPRLSGGVGVMTRGRPTAANGRNRSLDEAAAAALLRLGLDLHPDATGARSFAETADIIAGLDLVITVDTAVAHLAGSMGKRTWVLLPGFGVDWRWPGGRLDTPWYPSVRLFRQHAPGDWSGVIADVRATLDAA